MKRTLSILVTLALMLGVCGFAAADQKPAGSLTNLLLEDSAHWMNDGFAFDEATTEYNLTAWLETYGIRFTPVITGGAEQTVTVTMSGTGIEAQTIAVGNNESFVLNLTQARQSSNPEGTGERGIEDDCVYEVIIEAANATYTLNVTRPGLDQYVEKFTRATFDLGTIDEAEAGKSMTYWLYVPEDYDASKEYPVVLYLHGVGQMRNEATDVLLRNASATTFVYYGKECIVLAPQANYTDLTGSGGWADSNFDLTVFGNGAYAILQDVLADYSTDASRVYVVGLSMGGQGTCGMLASHPEQWAGAIVNAAPYAMDENSVLRLGNAIKEHNIPVWFSFCEDDESVSFEQSHDVLIPVLDELGVNYAISIYTPDDYLAPMRHFCWAPVWADEDILDWLLAQNNDEGAGTLNGLMVTDSALGEVELGFDPGITDYGFDVWEETYGVLFRPVIGGADDSSVTVTLSGSGIEDESFTLTKNETFELALDQNRICSNAEASGTRGIEDDCDYVVTITDAEKTYTVNIHRPGVSRYISDPEWGYDAPGEEYFTKQTFALNLIEGNEDDARQMYYWLHLPSDYDASKSYPIVMYLHGGGQTRNRADDIMVRNTIASAFLAKDKEDMIIIAPQANDTELAGGGWSGDEMQLTDFSKGAYALLNKTIADYSVDENRVYLIGLSAGSVGSSVLITNYAHEGVFTAALLSADPVYGSYVGAARLARALADTDLPVWYTQHERDATCWNQETGYNHGYTVFSNLRALLEDIEQIEGNASKCRITSFPYSMYARPTSHFTWANMYSDDMYLDWLLAQSK
ncbi:MAG: PHB depolymerase family esterase [Clostridia bacterium]|nr:PHB depolymerase family esterase [Clostridia bacterium]